MATEIQTHGDTGDLASVSNFSIHLGDNSDDEIDEPASVTAPTPVAVDSVVSVDQLSTAVSVDQLSNIVSFDQLSTADTANTFSTLSHVQSGIEIAYVQPQPQPQFIYVYQPSITSDASGQIFDQHNQAFALHQTPSLASIEPQIQYIQETPNVQQVQPHVCQDINAAPSTYTVPNPGYAFTTDVNFGPLGTLDVTCPEITQGTTYTTPEVAPSVSVSSLPATAATSTDGSPTAYPIVYVSPAGILTVLMREDIAVEMTIDKAIRVVNHRHKAVAATNSRGNSSSIFHTAAKMFQENTSTCVDLFWNRRARLLTEELHFSSETSCYKLTSEGVVACDDALQYMMDLSKDMSVSLLFSASGYGPHMMAVCAEVAQAATYIFHKKNAVTVLINGMRIYQNARGDVMVSCGPKYIRVSPTQGTLYLQTHFVEMAVEPNWRVKVKRGGHRVGASFNGFLVADEHLEAGFDKLGQLFFQPVVTITKTIIDKITGTELEFNYYIEDESDDSHKKYSSASGTDEEGYDSEYYSPFTSGFGKLFGRHYQRRSGLYRRVCQPKRWEDFNDFKREPFRTRPPLRNLNPRESDSAGESDGSDVREKLPLHVVASDASLSNRVISPLCYDTSELISQGKDRRRTHSKKSTYPEKRDARQSPRYPYRTPKESNKTQDSTAGKTLDDMLTKNTREDHEIQQSVSSSGSCDSSSHYNSSPTESESDDSCSKYEKKSDSESSSVGTNKPSDPEIVCMSSSSEASVDDKFENHQHNDQHQARTDEQNEEPDTTDEQNLTSKSDGNVDSSLQAMLQIPLDTSTHSDGNISFHIDSEGYQLIGRPQDSNSSGIGSWEHISSDSCTSQLNSDEGYMPNNHIQTNPDNEDQSQGASAKSSQEFIPSVSDSQNDTPSESDVFESAASEIDDPEPQMKMLNVAGLSLIQESSSESCENKDSVIMVCKDSQSSLEGGSSNEWSMQGRKNPKRKGQKKRAANIGSHTGVSGSVLKTGSRKYSKNRDRAHTSRDSEKKVSFSGAKKN